MVFIFLKILQNVLHPKIILNRKQIDIINKKMNEINEEKHIFNIM